MVRALSLPGCGCRGAFQFAVMARLAAAGEQFDLVAGASSGAVCGAVAVAGLADEGPAMWHAMAGRPVVSARYWATERSVFGMSAILREALERFVPEERIHQSSAELLISTTRALRFAMGAKDALVVHSNRHRQDMHAVLVASCTIPVLYARLPRLDGEIHVDGAVTDNTLISTLLDRGADDITLVTPYREGLASPTLFQSPRLPAVPPHVRLRLIYPERTLRLRHFDFTHGLLQEALEMPHCIRILEPSA